jgi:hypothetical protein
VEFLPEIRPLIVDRLMALGPGAPNVGMRPQLEQLQHDLPAKAKNRDFAAACLAGLWLYHDFLDESHSISQDLHTVEGSCWHALMHRREPDYWNSKYWFRRVGEHPIYVQLRAEVIELCKGHTWPSCIGEKTWDPMGFVDLCEKQADPNAMAHEHCRNIQAIEWRLLFEYCHERAFASG